MSKRFTKLIAIFATAMAVLQVSAQVKQEGKRSLLIAKSQITQETEQQKLDQLKAFPKLLGKTLPMETPSPFFTPTVTIRPKVSRKMVTVNPELAMWGNIVSKEKSGMFSFHPVEAINFEQLADYSKAFFNGGSGLVDNELHGIFLDTSMSSLGIILLKHFAFNTTNWQISEEPLYVSNFALLALETANDPKTGEVFGEFYTEDLKNFEWGVIDYKTLTRTTIAPATHSYVALGIANDGFAYGISKEGDLYQIDRKTGTETLKGSTGVNITDDDGSYYYQSGEFDNRTNEFYWASTDKDGKFELYTVDLATGHVTPVGGYSTPLTLMALTFPVKATANGAPAAAENLQTEFKEGSLTGKLKFNVPTKKFDGSALTGNVDYIIYANSAEVSKGKAEAGKEVSTDLTVNEGMVNFIVVLSNEAGDGPRAKHSMYAGNDSPKAVDNLKLTLDENGHATVTWEAPKEGVHKGYIGQLTYDVFRNVGGTSEKVSSGQTATEFSETLTKGKLSSYSYSVQAINSTKKSDLATTNGETYGNAMEVPFFDDFLTMEDSKVYTIIDANKDKCTWYWSNAKGGVFKCKYHPKNHGDDWLITPPIHMKQGKTYNVSFKALAIGGTTYPERLEVKWGTNNTIEAMTGELLPATVLNNRNYKTFTGQIKATTDGNYFVGFHGISDPNMFSIFLDSLTIEGAADEKAPAMVQDLTATADPTAALKATLKFKAPSKAIDKTDLTSITKIIIRNKDRLVKEIKNPAPGSAQEVVDDAAAQGMNNYEIVAYNEADFGQKANVSVYVGQDVPMMGKIKATDLVTSANLKWDVPTGAHKGVILPAEVTYQVNNVTDEGELGDELTKIKGKTEYTVTGLNTNEGKQNYKHWAIKASNDAGESSWVAAGIIVGKPYTLPFHNSFKNGSIEGQFMGLERSSSSTSWALTKDVSCDNDNGAVVFNPSKPGTSALITGKISLRGAENPKLIFYYRADENAQQKVELRFAKKNGDVTEPVWTSEKANVTTTNGEWKNFIVDVPTELTNEDFVFLRIIGIADNITKVPVYMDNINIVDPLQKDAAVEVTATDNVKKGQMAEINVKVTNIGLDELKNTKLELTVNGKIIKEDNIESLKLLDKKEYKIEYRTTTLDKAETLNVKASVPLDDDLEPDNNEAEAIINCTAADVPAPKNLTNVKVDDNKLKLKWEAPESTIEQKSDDFESYEPWSTSFGNWTTIDEDQGLAAPLAKGATYQHQGEQFAFMDWQPSDIFKSGQGLDPHSGSKSLVAIYQVNEDKKLIAASNWLISPILSGKAQTISFWVNNVNSADKSYGKESFDVLVSNTDNQKASFQKVGDTHEQSTATWTEVKVDVPEGTRYFAIHHNTSSDQAFIFMIDDITYESSTGPVSYNIYRDGEYLSNSIKLESGDIVWDGTDHNYSVTAVYADGSESEPTSIKVTTVIQKVGANGEILYDVYTIDGKLLLKDAKSLKSLGKGIYVINGQKTIIR